MVQLHVNHHNREHSNHGISVKKMLLQCLYYFTLLYKSQSLTCVCKLTLW